MLRMFIEFLGVKSKGATHMLDIACGKTDSILIDAFSKFGTQKVPFAAFGAEQGFVADIHRTMCKINSHFTYDRSAPAFCDRIASPHDEDDWARGVEIVIEKLDQYFYSVIGQPISVHFDLEVPFRDRFVAKLGLKSPVRGDGLGRPASA